MNQPENPADRIRREQGIGASQPPVQHPVFMQPPIVQPPTQPPSKKWYQKRSVLAVVLLLLIVGSAGGVYAAFVASGVVNFGVGTTAAEITGMALVDTSTGSSTVNLTGCSFPTAPTVTCAATGANPGETYQLTVTVENNGAVIIPTVSASGIAVLVQAPVTFDTSALTYSTGATTTSTIMNTSSSTTSLTTGQSWNFVFTFAVPATAINGGAVTITATVNG